MKRIHFILIGVFVVLIILFFHFFTILRISTVLNENKIVLVRKFSNPNRNINLFLPNPQNSINVGDLIIHKDVRFADKSFRRLENIANRVYGLPGNTVEIRNKEIFNNNEKVKTDKSKLFFKYRVSFDYPCDCKEVLSDFDFLYISTIGDGVACEIIANPYEVKEIEKLDFVTNVREDIHLRNTNLEGYFPNHMFYSWNKDFFGPVYVPEKDVTVMLNPRNVALYARIIDRFENHQLIYNLLTITINDIVVDKYTIQNNYYFVVSDNRDKGIDSRLWGFLPESHIVGKVVW